MSIATHAERKRLLAGGGLALLVTLGLLLNASGERSVQTEFAKSHASYRCLTTMDAALSHLHDYCDGLPLPGGKTIVLDDESEIVRLLVTEGLLAGPVRDAWGRPLVLRTQRTTVDVYLPSKCRGLMSEDSWSDQFLLISTGEDGLLDEDWTFLGPGATPTYLDSATIGGDLIVQFDQGRVRAPDSGPKHDSWWSSVPTNWDQSTGCD